MHFVSSSNFLLAYVTSESIILFYAFVLRNCCFLLDNLVKAAFSQKGGIEAVKDIFKDKFQVNPFYFLD